MTGLPDLTADRRALHVCKRPVPVPVAFALADGVCETLEGPVHYQKGDALLTGVQGERYPVRRDLFMAAYTPVPPAAMGEDGLDLKAPSGSLALRLDQALAVPVGWQNDPLQGRPGDWLLRYADGSHSVVKDAIFRASYGPAPQEARWPPPLASPD
jgi:hypothetical protein